jgi:DNA-binding response OmpR family regulator
MSPVSNLKVLVVEDHPDIAMLYTRLLRGSTIQQANNGLDACHALSTETFDLVILDLHLGTISGLDVLRYARSLNEHQDTPIVVISADDSLRPQARLLGADYWINKPIEIDRLYDYLNATFVESRMGAMVAQGVSL